MTTTYIANNSLQTEIRIDVSPNGRAYAYTESTDTDIVDFCSRVNREESSLADAFEIAEDMGLGLS